MKKFQLIWFVLFIFGISFGFEKVFVEDNGEYLQLKVQNINYNSKKSKNRYKTHKKRESYYLSKKGSKVFHRPNCRFAKKIKNKIIYKTRKEARKHHLRPCKVCKP